MLGRGRYTGPQRAIARALWDPAVSTVACPAGHSVGKSFLAAGALLGWLTLHPDSVVVSTSPSNAQLSGVLWKEIARARNRSPLLRHVGRLTKNPNKLDYGDGWFAIGYATNKAERLQGFHSTGPLLNIVDEASGITDPELWATLRSLKPRKTLLISNPLRADGPFYEACLRAESDPRIRLIRIPATDSPDIGLEHSPRGLADASWLRDMRSEFGDGSLVWKVRVEARFPDASEDALIPLAWLDRCGTVEPVRGGDTRLAIDLAGGHGGDQTVLLVRDDNGVLEIQASNQWSLEVAASKAALLVQKYAVAPHRVTWDAEGLGTDFANRLSQVGIVGAQPYRGATPSPAPRFANLRAACHWLLRQRLDPERRDRWDRPRPGFAIPREYLARLRPEVRELRYSLDARGRVLLRPKEEVTRVLRHSPDFSDTLAQSFAYPHS